METAPLSGWKWKSVIRLRARSGNSGLKCETRDGRTYRGGKTEGLNGLTFRLGFEVSHLRDQVNTHRYQCRRCRKSFIPPLPGIKPYRHSSEPFRKAIYQHHRDGIAGSVLADREGIGSVSVERFYHEYTELNPGGTF